MQPQRSREKLLSWILPWLAPVIATLISWLLSPILPKANFAMIYLTGVLFTAVFTHVKPAIICALLSFLAYNFFHTEPHFTLLMIHRDDMLTAGLLILVAVVTGQLAASLHQKVVAMEAHNQWNDNQVKLAQELSIGMSNAEVINTLAKQITDNFQFGAVCFLAQSGSGNWVASDNNATPPEPPPEYIAGDSVRFRHQSRQAAVYFYADGECQGIVRITAGAPFSTLELTRLEGFVGMARLAWDRVQLSTSLRQEVIKKEREQLRSALLSSVSHDLKTPLAAMIGSVSTLIDLHDDLDRDQQAELARNTLAEAQRLDRHIQKLLDMARLGHGELPLDRDWTGLEDIISVVIKRGKAMLDTLQIAIELEPNLPLLYVHPALIEQALFNILENAIRFAPADSVIRVKGFKEENRLCIDISDRGPGIPEDTWRDIFDMFYTFSYGDRYPSGTGVGLAISQGILKAHGGEALVVASSPVSGTTIRAVVPLPDNPQQEST